MVTPTNLHDNGYTTVQANYLQSSPLARWVFTTDAESAVLAAYSTTYGSYSSEIGVIVDGVPYSAVAMTQANLNAPTVALPAGNKTVEFVAGLTTKPPASAVLGTFLKGVLFECGSTSSQIAPTTPATRVVVYGDSIAVGDGATHPVIEGWPVLLRADNPVAVEAWGWRSLFDDCPDEAGRIALSTQLASFAPGSVWLAIGTNDYGLNKWAAAAFGTAYADLLDKLHADLPTATIYCQTPIERTSEVANGGGDTLGAYRTQIATACGTRGPWAVLVDGTAAAFPQAPGDLSDGVHPTTAGHALYYAAVKAALGL